jgi:RNA polymerase sigma-70 factor (ECF subfamily)
VESNLKLVTDLQDGSLEALGELYDRHQRMVFRTALSITGDPEAAGDLLHEVFLRLHRFAHRVDPERPLEPWLYRVTVNQSCTWVKRRRWMQPIEELADWLIGDNRNSPPQHMERHEERQALEQALAALPLAHRTVIVLYYVNDLAVQEIADILDVPAGTVKSRLYYGRKALKERLDFQADRLSEVIYEFT